MALVLGLSGPCLSGEEPPPAGAPGDPDAALASAMVPATTDDDSVFDRIWGHTVLYEDDTNPILQSLRFTGRAQFDYARVESHQGDFDNWIVRRLRTGFVAQVFEDFTIKSIAVFNPQTSGPLYVRLTDAYLAWSPDPVFELTVGKQSAPFTLDGHTSSKELITIDRNNLTNNLWYTEEYIPGVSISGEKGPWRYFAGFYSSGSESPEFGNFDAGYFGLLTLGYDFSEALGVEEALLYLDYVYNEPNPKNTFTRPFGQVGSVNFRYGTGKWGIRTDVSAGRGYLGQSNVFGFVFNPYYNLTGKFQVVARYTYLNSGDENGVRLQRYESEVVSGRGDAYQEFFAGLNYYFYGHKLKIQTGAKYAHMSDRANDGGAYNGWGFTTGLRIGW